MGRKMGRARGFTAILVLLALALTTLAMSGVGAATTWVPDLTTAPYKGQRGIDPSGRYYWTDVSPGFDNVHPDGPGVVGTTYMYGVHNSDHDPATGTYPFPYCSYPAQPLNETGCPFRVGVYAERSTNGGVTWSQLKRLNPETVQGERSTLAAPPSGALAADGVTLDDQWVYVAWVSQMSYYNHTVGASPRVLYFIVNDSYGTSGGWPYSFGDPVNLQMSPADGRVDYPSLAAGPKGIVYLVWTNSDKGNIMFAESSDHGATWSTRTLGKTARIQRGWVYGNEGKSGKPAVATSDDGMTVGVSWMASKRGDLLSVISTDGGATFSDPETIAKSGTNANGGAPQAAGGPGRIAFVWTTRKGAFMREYDTTGGWASKHTVARTSGETPPSYTAFENAAIGLSGASTVGVAYSGCFVSYCPHYARSRGSDLVWVESQDGGTTWSAPEMLANSQDPAAGGGVTENYMNNWATVVYGHNTAGVATRYVRWNAFEPSAFFYQLMFRTAAVT